MNAEDILQDGIERIVGAMENGRFTREQLMRIRASFQASLNATDRALAKGPIGHEDKPKRLPRHYSQHFDLSGFNYGGGDMIMLTSEEHEHLVSCKRILTELVALKEMKERSKSSGDFNLLTEYVRRKTIAWDAARDVLNKTKEEK